MSFGLCGAPATFQRFVNEVLWGLDFVFPYLDDILVALKSEEEHESHLRAVFSRLDQYGLRINQAKTVLNLNNVEFLGYWITPEGIRPTESKVQAIVDYKKPETVQDLRRILGMLNFYRRFLKNAAEDQAILNDFLKSSKKNDKRPIPWTEEAEQKFIKCKTELSKAALLTFPDPECPLALFTDASDRAMGAHVSGKDNMVADTLSRISEIISIDYDIIAEKQQDDTELSNLRSQNKSVIFKEHRLPSRKTLWCDISTSRIRPYIPEEFRMNVFTSIHGLFHPGIKTTVREVTSRYIWLKINKDIRNWTKGCINCQKSKITRHTKTEYGEFGKPDERFGTVHIDLIGPLPPSEGKTYCLTLIDRFTNWVEVLPLEDIKADTIIKSFYKEWISRYGTPCHLITDRGMQFMSQKLKEFAKMCGFQLKHTTSYHPQSNGKIERFHRTLKTAISSHYYIRWTERLPSVLLGLRSSIYGSSDFSIAQMVFGKIIRLPGEFFQDSQQTRDKDDLIKNLQKDMSSLQPMKSRINRNPNVFIHKDLQSCSHVFIRKNRVKKPLEPAYEGPFRVLKRTVKYFTVMVKGKEDNVSLDRLKPAYLLKESYPEVDDRRQQPGIQQDLQPSKARTQKVHFEEPQRTRSVVGERSRIRLGLQPGASIPKVEELLTTQPILAAYDVRKPTMVSSDASSYGLGAVLKQEGKNGIWRPVAYSSRTMTPTEKRYAQIEKEALEITWACERFQDFLLGKRFQFETDHKPLILQFSTKELSSLTPRLQRFRMRMMRFGFEIVHIPGKELLDADALSRQLLTTEGDKQEDTTPKAVVNYLEQGWPDTKKMSQAVLSYWHVKDELGVQNALLMRSCRLVILASMKLEILDNFHAGHFGITKTRLRARETVWWPGISEEIAETVRKCSVCIHEAASKHEPLIPTNFPTRPWQKIGMYLFKFENKWYLVVIDYFSRFPEMIQLNLLTANVVVRSCKSIFARHLIPETVVSDNGTQFGAAREFANFARQYGFTHVTSSPRFPQSNGMAEAGVKIAKLILKKNQDPSLGLLEYRSTPLENGYSPAELLMGRNLRTTLPFAPENLNP
ncbi:hypothetical protein LAZ67_X001595, partial [Cordylochernes scorpioides]